MHLLIVDAANVGSRPGSGPRRAPGHRGHGRPGPAGTRGGARRDRHGSVLAPANGSERLPHTAGELPSQLDGGFRRPLARGVMRHAGAVTERNVLGDELEPCGTDPVTGFFRDGCCRTGPDDLGSHTICAVVTAEFLDHQRGVGNDLSTPRPEYRFPGLVAGDRWCVTAVNWARAYRDGVAAPVVLAASHEAVLEIVPLEMLREHAVDVPADPGSLEP
jgi:uncharacterized protein (DUF2237 family)